jgi:hypothetical protein
MASSPNALGVCFAGVLPHDNACNIERPIDPQLLPELL